MKGWPIYAGHWRTSGATLHTVWAPTYPPMPPPPVPLPHLELPHKIEWVLPGKVASKTFMDRDRPAKDGHDTGLGIVHVCVPVHVGLVKHAAFSKYKLMYGASSVVLEGTPIAVWDTGLRRRALLRIRLEACVHRVRDRAVQARLRLSHREPRR